MIKGVDKNKKRLLKKYKKINNKNKSLFLKILFLLKFNK